MPYLRDLAIVLKKDAFRERDRRYTLFGRDHGLIVAVARGGSMPASKQAGHLEPFCLAEVMVAKGSAFDKLCVAAMAEDPVGRARNLAAFAACGAVAELLVALLRPGLADAPVFHLLHECVATAAALPPDASAARTRLFAAAASLKILDRLGYAPPLRPPPGGEEGPALALARFLRRAPLVDALRVTAPSAVIHAACDAIEAAFETTPLERAPKGSVLIRSTVGRA